MYITNSWIFFLLQDFRLRKAILQAVQKHIEILEKRIYEDKSYFLIPRELEISIYNPTKIMEFSHEAIVTKVTKILR